MIQQDELIERWSNVLRVLDAMPEHERQKHWDMSIWGEKTECGTVACAAGHCGLDPWFRERGFKLDFFSEGHDTKISDVRPFFGNEGSTRIFLDSTVRPVETVAAEVRDFIAELQKLSPLITRGDTPAIGELWDQQGGIYAGPRLGLNGAPDYHLIVGPEHDSYVTWREAGEWAAALSIEGFRDYTLPSRSEQLALYDRVRVLFQPRAYWSSETHASHSSYAWGQDFGNGSQDDWNKLNKLRARAVRRLIIH